MGIIIWTYTYMLATIKWWLAVVVMLVENGLEYNARSP